MPVLLDIRELRKSYGGRTVLDGTNLAITDTQRIALLGRNGAGKTTLIRCILGQEEAEGGTIVRHPDLRLATLAQHDRFLPGESVGAFLERESEQPGWRCGELAARFGISHELLGREASTLSGGWRTRTKLVGLLLQEPNLLLLDEPTNFLDLRTQLLLQHFLASWRGAALVISHDRSFLSATCNHTAEMNRGRLRCEPGDVEAFLARTEEDRDRVRRANANTMAKRRQLETFIAKNKAGANTASQARSKMKQLERLEIQDEEQADDAAPVIRLPQVERRDGTACRIENLAVGYDERVIAGGLDYDLPRGARIALVGDNGQGKTTLLKTLAGVLPPVSGKAVWTHGADVGVYGQHVYEKLSGDGTVLDHLTRINAGRVSSQKVLDTAGAFLFRGDDVRKPLRVLSGGERARGCLAGLFLAGHNVLMLDEPTNHLDVQTVSALAEALADYAGTVIVASHDRGFIARVSTAVVEARDGRLSVFPGDWAAYLWRLEREADEADGPAAAAKRAKSAAKDAPPPPDAKAANRRRYDLEKQRNNAERKVARLKTELDEAENALNDAGEDPDIITGLAERCADLGRRLAEAEEAWLAAAEALEQHGP